MLDLFQNRMNECMKLLQFKQHLATLHPQHKDREKEF